MWYPIEKSSTQLKKSLGIYPIDLKAYLFLCIRHMVIYSTCALYWLANNLKTNQKLKQLNQV